MHRKIVVVDGERAFVGGINFGDVHLRSFGAESKQDYAVEASGPIVDQIDTYCRAWAAADGGRGRLSRRWRYWMRPTPRELLQPDDNAQALFVIRDNEGHPTDIETMYRAGIRNAQRRIVLANAYFFPGFRLIRDLAKAANRGVDVRLIMQGNPDRPLTVGASSIVYEDLLAAGVKVYRYMERPLHAKVAVIDDDWATVGSSNLDPTSLGLNLEANLLIRDRNFNAVLAKSLDRLTAEWCEEVVPERPVRASLWRRLVLTGAYHLTRRMTSWGRRIREGAQTLRPMEPGTGRSAEPTDAN
jgi:cardiolipin synthase A/B